MNTETHRRAYAENNVPLMATLGIARMAVLVRALLESEVDDPSVTEPDSGPSQIDLVLLGVLSLDSWASSLVEGDPAPASQNTDDDPGRLLR